MFQMVLISLLCSFYVLRVAADVLDCLFCKRASVVIEKANILKVLLPGPVLHVVYVLIVLILTATIHFTEVETET